MIIDILGDRAPLAIGNRCDTCVTVLALRDNNLGRFFSAKRSHDSFTRHATLLCNCIDTLAFAEIGMNFVSNLRRCFLGLCGRDRLHIRLLWCWRWWRGRR
ncbi:hypothetical protein, partial [Brucella cytisi]|uniref:hypothetical protein n=1 Tax=Brucella cytisi TaxID=407152 RepID=UPI0035BC585D